MNKQCRNCTKPTPDEELKTIGTAVYCLEWVDNVSYENIVHNLMSASYADEDLQAFCAIVRELEETIEKLVFEIEDLTFEIVTLT